MRPARRTVLAIAVAGLAAVPSAASAQVFHDDDPAKKEYSVPLEDARGGGGGGNGAGGGSGSSSGGSSQGTPGDTGADPAQAARSSKAKQRRRAKTERRRKARRREERARSNLFGKGIKAGETSAEPALAGVGGGSSTPWTLGALAIVMLPALAAGLARRRAARGD